VRGAGDGALHDVSVLQQCGGREEGRRERGGEEEGRTTGAESERAKMAGEESERGGARGAGATHCFGDELADLLLTNLLARHLAVFLLGGMPLGQSSSDGRGLGGVYGGENEHTYIYTHTNSLSVAHRRGVWRRE
jgi:hypothetical protein